MTLFRNTVRNTALAALLMASLPALAVTPFVADYQANVKGTIKANAQMTLSSAGGDRWNYVLSVSSPVASVRRAKGEARWSGDVKADRTGPVKLREGDMDAMLLNLAIVRDVAAGKPLNYRLVENGTARAQSYRNLGKDTISVGGQSRTATKVSRSSDDKQVIVWIVDGLPVPARILQTRGGNDELDLVLRSVR